MKVHHIHQPYDVLFVTVDECPIKAHKNTFIELVYIFDGEGIYHINQTNSATGRRTCFWPCPWICIIPG
ncbi:hypothetical protein [Dyadobacter sp. 676]|uniref:AraC-type arabinose-binding/dimerisation domain-containing protein n=1 Tax=Dyadobacter sp. 676 TaxID=3088362 RepID=A0AAU8FMI9_9BACT